MMDNSNIKFTDEELEVDCITYEDNQQEWQVRVAGGTEEIVKQLKAQILENQKLRDLIEKRLQLDKFEYESGAKLGNLEFKKLLDFETKLLQSILKESQA